MAQDKEISFKNAEANRPLSPEESEDSESNDVLADASFDFLRPAVDFAREEGDTKRAALLSQRERVILEMALNPNGVQFGGNERRLVIGAMADALDVYITDKVQFDGDGGEGVESAEKLFRELGKELFGDVSISVNVASTSLEQVNKLFEKIPDTSILAPMREQLKMALDLIDKDGGASKLAKESPADLKARLERTQFFLAQGLSQSNELVEAMRMSGETTFVKANEMFGDAFQVMHGLHKLQGLIDGLDRQVRNAVADREREVKVNQATQTANRVADRVEGKPPDISNDEQENKEKAKLIQKYVQSLVDREARSVLDAGKKGSNFARQFGQFVEVFSQIHPGVSSGEAFLRIARAIREKKEHAMKTIKASSPEEV